MGRKPKLKAVKWTPAVENRMLVWIAEMRELVRMMSKQVDELELYLRVFDVLGSKQAAQKWFNNVSQELGGRPVDLRETARGRKRVLRELDEMDSGGAPNK